MPDRSQAKVRAEVANERTRTLMVRTAQRVLSPEDSEDAAHDAVVQALLHADKFREDAQVSTWLYRIAFNAALVRHRCAQRTTRRLLRVEREGPQDGLPSGATESTTAAHQLEDIELRGQLRAAVEQLPAGYRVAIQRCVYQEQPPEQVAAALGITESALRTRITRARDQLRELLGEAPAPARATRPQRAARPEGPRARAEWRHAA